MTTINHECYVSLEVAKLLKEAGFDWETFSHWTESDVNNPDFKFSGLSDKPILYDGYTIIDEDTFVGRKKDWNNYNNECQLIYNYSAPTLDIAQRWLREVKGIEIYAHVFYDSREMLDELVVYVYEVNHIIKQIEDWINSYDVYHSYEEAQEAGIKKVLEIILEKGE